jgi:integrative and conjugative element protein (TIGR02256 family)
MISVWIANRRQRLTFEPGVLEHFKANRQLAVSATEAGGQLFAAIEGNEIKVRAATGPSALDKRSRYSFVPSNLAAHISIATMFIKGLHYVGDWHTHPEDCPSPSNDDRRSIADTYLKSKHQLAGIIMVIVGRLDVQHGLYVAIQDENGLHEIRLPDQQI